MVLKIVVNTEDNHDVVVVGGAGQLNVVVWFFSKEVASVLLLQAALIPTIAMIAAVPRAAADRFPQFDLMAES